MTANRQTSILIVDDEPALREMLADALASQFVRVHTAASADEALALAHAHGPDLIITDINLGDSSGLDVIDRVRRFHADIPAVVITGHTDSATLTQASRRQPAEVMAKPLDLPRLRARVREELARHAARDQNARRTLRLRRLACQSNKQRRAASRQLETACAELTDNHQTLSRRIDAQNIVLAYQQMLLAARTDDDVFRAFFQTFVRHSGPIFGAAMLCDDEAQLHLAGRFGVPQPDNATFCRALAAPVVDQTIAASRDVLLDAEQHADMFDPAIHRYLPGLTVMTVPLLPVADELIGVIVLYRKGEQPILDADLTLAEMMSSATALAIERND